MNPDQSFHVMHKSEPHLISSFVLHNIAIQSNPPHNYLFPLIGLAMISYVHHSVQHGIWKTDPYLAKIISFREGLIKHTEYVLTSQNLLAAESTQSVQSV
ncbi:hypothetical protein CU098_007508 [Rhizopus stolonifer]|uniref:Uncharacterized protein n=1 Tax=Rhizopus stolonifer TaxID=4846 RepID=A0A367J120_RHIST|nr:hypothetical protein CU098_007508 [Rhizopus stolonifer]